jgi:hypothetical protein
MSARELLGIAIRGYGLYLVVGAIIGAFGAVIQFVFGDFTFGMTFRLLVVTALEFIVGFVLMLKAEGILSFMGMPAAPPTTSSPTA